MIVLVGLNHKTAPLAVRERLFAGCREEMNLLAGLQAIDGVREILHLATCNRVELVASVDDALQSMDALRSFLAKYGGLTNDEAACLYGYQGEEAIKHLFRVTSSLDSLVMGEAQILGQVKEAYRQALAQNATGIALNRLMHRAFRTAKRVRTETGIAANPVSVSFAAVELAKKIFGTLAGKKTLVIGAGEMAELTCTHLIGNGAEGITVANRSLAQAAILAEKYHGRALSLTALDEALCDADIVISSTGAPTYIVTQEMVRHCLRKRKNRLLFLIDIAVPRDIDPAADGIENVYLYNIDNLQDIVDENIKGRRREALKAEQIVSEEVTHYLNWLKELEAVPTIVSLRTKAEGIVRMEMSKAENWMSKLENGDREKVDALVNGIVNKLLHAPVAVMKEESAEFNSQDIVAAARQLFRLDD
ncbi:MAG: glutamyl-tRNA reductase [Deltaproteobacteria bacterium HGW-Deltaproteobacteria-6]|jgi:glutamyl-tRNA reductase|nr:MAG: glutamyl-tRNA reductase [Deltaproteobacteria bacterium HGW-Deltaproteobacteria-6]